MSACGGTHVARTGGIGAIAVLSSERLRGGTRLEFVCGGRALRALHAYRDAVAGCIRHVSVAPEELPAAIERLQGESKDQRKALKGLQERLARYQAAEMAAHAERVNGVKRLVEAVEGQDQGGLKAMAVAVCAAPGFEVTLFSQAEPFVVVVARSRDCRMDAADVLRTLLARFGGRGGGKADLAQAGRPHGQSAGDARCRTRGDDAVGAGLVPAHYPATCLLLGGHEGHVRRVLLCSTWRGGEASASPSSVPCSS